MNNTQKFRADIERIKKREKRENQNILDKARFCNKVINFFEQQNKQFGGLPHSLAEYWKETYIDCISKTVAPSIDNAGGNTTPTNNTSAPLCEDKDIDNALEKIIALQSFLDDTDELSALNSNDWKEIARLVGFEADDLALHELNRMMSVIVEKGGIS